MRNKNKERNTTHSSGYSCQLLFRSIGRDLHFSRDKLKERGEFIDTETNPKNAEEYALSFEILELFEDVMERITIAFNPLGNEMLNIEAKKEVIARMREKYNLPK